MSIEDAVARDLVAVLFVTFTFGGKILFLILATLAETWRKARVGEKSAELKQAMLERGFTPEQIVKVLNAGRDGGA